MTKREKDTRFLLRVAATRLNHGYLYEPGKRCPAPSCFRCQIERFLRVRPPAPRPPSSPGSGR
jgi:hypothetical protein